MADNVDDGPLSEEDLQTARVVLERFPTLAGENVQKTLLNLARAHRDKGASRFELYFGLRPPASAGHGNVVSGWV